MAVVEPDRPSRPRRRGEEGNDIAPHLLRASTYSTENYATAIDATVVSSAFFGSLQNRSIAAPFPFRRVLRHTTACLHERVMLDHWRLSSTDLVLTYGYVLPMRPYSSFSGQKFESGAYAVDTTGCREQLNEFFRNTKAIPGVNPDFAVNVASSSFFICQMFMLVSTLFLTLL
ncbi:hypothetical protein G5I_08339 [Acromyrmex echinatior]|uniref:Uncharacterized protein n=1 Tax=Acromyrmex echinatior TaxID=103372 RepID=F4WR93_ACREC|nr:hypothetical protein G5I_08339 [Acromyrmex echinatior]